LSCFAETTSALTEYGIVATAREAAVNKAKRNNLVGFKSLEI
jgi:hypothetical protein